VDVELVSAAEDSPAFCRVPISNITYLAIKSHTTATINKVVDIVLAHRSN